MREIAAGMQDALEAILRAESCPPILVFGDLFLERLIFGDVEQVCPDAPVPVVRITGEECQIGGAGRVAACARAFGAKATVLAAIGSDDESAVARRIMDELELDTRPLVTSPDWPTAVRTRVIGGTPGGNFQTLLRLDRQSGTLLPAAKAEELIRRCERLIPESPLVLITDEQLGVCGEQTISRVVSQAAQHGSQVIVKPAQTPDWRRYAGANAIAVEFADLCRIFGRNLASVQETLQAAQELVKRFCIDQMFIAWSTGATAWTDAQGRSEYLRRPSDRSKPSCNTADLALASLGYALALGAEWPMALQLMQISIRAAADCSGPHRITRERLLELLRSKGMRAGRKTISLAELQDRLVRFRQAGKQVVLTWGSFDSIDAREIAYLQRARGLGDCLVVALCGAASPGQPAGQSPPVKRLSERAQVLSALEYVDYVFYFDRYSLSNMAEAIRPDILARWPHAQEIEEMAAIMEQFWARGLGTQIVDLSAAETSENRKVPSPLQASQWQPSSAERNGDEFELAVILPFPRAA